jgi:hypothetical protein
VELCKEVGFEVTEEDFMAFMGTGEANFLGGVANKFGVSDSDVTKAKARFFEIYIGKVRSTAASLEDLNSLSHRSYRCASVQHFK